LSICIYVKLGRREDDVELQIDRRVGTAIKHRIE